MLKHFDYKFSNFLHINLSISNLCLYFRGNGEVYYLLLGSLYQPQSLDLHLLPWLLTSQQSLSVPFVPSHPAEKMVQNNMVHM